MGGPNTGVRLVLVSKIKGFSHVHWVDDHSLAVIDYRPKIFDSRK
jgi:hypothetical protein